MVALLIAVPFCLALGFVLGGMCREAKRLDREFEALEDATERDREEATRILGARLVAAAIERTHKPAELGPVRWWN